MPITKQLGVLILDKADWLLPENGPGYRSGSGLGDGRGYGEGISCLDGSGFGDGKKPYSKHVYSNGCGWGIGMGCDYND